MAESETPSVSADASTEFLQEHIEKMKSVSADASTEFLQQLIGKTKSIPELIDEGDRDLVRSRYESQPEMVKEFETKGISQLIDEGDWDLVRSRCESRPDLVKGFVDPVSGRTILHDLCSKPPAPEDIFRMVLKLFPEATKVQSKNFMATPLHILCWSSQRSIRKVQILLVHMRPEDLLIRNRFGGTALHSACGSHAWLPVIKAIVQANPSIVMERTYEYNHTALTALWHSHLQSIPGHMQIARILEGEEVHEGLFERFWEKVEFLGRESFKLSSACPDDVDSSMSDYILHGLMLLRAPLNTIKVAIRRNPAWASFADANGNYPLHHVVIRRPFRVKDIEPISELLRAYPEAASKRNRQGDSPLFIAIRDRMAWEEGLGEIANADTECLATTDEQTGLYPFLLAASLAGRVAVNTTYQLLCAKPYLLKDAIGPKC